MPEQSTSHQDAQFRSSEGSLGAVRRSTAPADQAGGECELVVFWVRRSTRRGECGVDLDRGSLLRVEGERALCLACADLDHLEYLPRGDAALTRRARRTSVLQAVVVEWSRTRQRYERQGVLVEPAALRQAEEECLADAELRARRREQGSARREITEQAYSVAFAAAVRARFPGCPDLKADQVAMHACRKASDRIGRAAAAKALDPQGRRTRRGRPRATRSYRLRSSSRTPDRAGTGPRAGAGPRRSDLARVGGVQGRTAGPSRPKFVDMQRTVGSRLVVTAAEPCAISPARHTEQRRGSQS